MSHLSRRQFLEDSMFAARRGGASSSVSSLAADEKQAKPERKAPHHLIGVNETGKRICGFTNRTDVDLVAICDRIRRWATTKQRIRRSGPPAETYQDMRQLFEDKSIDCISTTTPNHWHANSPSERYSPSRTCTSKPVSQRGRRPANRRVAYSTAASQGGHAMPLDRGRSSAIEYIEAGKIGE
jgi:hypothetical protein